ncbi:2-oxoacid:acceptor oxidoreductase subunit alpha [candidate division WOR-3 bacterium]|nr:2-oxoacid:acceptor oxidoreductase subunit alpha [candidate division WOR-3 bacterium]
MSKLEPGTYFMQGDEASVEGAIHAGCKFFAGYPITPATEIAERMARRLRQAGGVFLQLEDEITAIAAIIGASWTGTKAMTATSGPGFSLMQENLGYACMTETPIVIVDVQRSGPSTGQPTRAAQGDVMQARWGSHGDYEVIALAPNSVQEMFDLTITAFNLSERYRVPAIVLSDADIGHMRGTFVIPEKVEIVDRKYHTKPVSYNAFAYDENLVPNFPKFGQGHRVHITGLTHDISGYPKTTDAKVHEALVTRLVNKIRLHREDICRAEVINPHADSLVVAYGSPSNSVYEVVNERADVGLFRPITLWPFPEEQLRECAAHARRILVLEMNMGQIYWEVERIARKSPCEKIELLTRLGGDVHTPEEILEKLA